MSSLLYVSLEEWQAVRWPLLWRLIRSTADNLNIPFEAIQHETEPSPPAAAVADAYMPAADADAAATGAASSKEEEHKQSEEKEASGMEGVLTPGQAAAVAREQLNVLRPVLLFWSLIDGLHSAFAPPSGASYGVGSSESFVSSTSSAWYRRWRRSPMRAASLATFRSLLRRETDILAHLTGPLLRAYEANCAATDLRTLLDNIGATTIMDKEGCSLAQMLHHITTIVPSS